VKKQSKLKVLLRMGKLVRPLTGFMLLAVLMGTFGFLCAQFIPILGGFAVLHGLKIRVPLSLTAVCVLLMVIALLRAVLRYGEQRTNHYIAFTLLAIIRDKVFRALRRLCPAKLECARQGDLISLKPRRGACLGCFLRPHHLPGLHPILVDLVMVLFIVRFTGA
jgi:ATP-binding cassette subfamily C protein